VSEHYRLCKELRDTGTGTGLAADVIEAQEAKIERLQGELNARDDLGIPVWQPMKTALRDGTELLLAVERRAGISGRCLVGHYMPGGHCVEDHPPIAEGWYFWNGSMFDKASKPIAWMPLPEAAAAGGEA